MAALEVSQWPNGLIKVNEVKDNAIERWAWFSKDGHVAKRGTATDNQLIEWSARVARAFSSSSEPSA